MKALGGSLILLSVAGFGICFTGAMAGRNDVAAVGFVMVMVGLFGALTTIVLAEFFDA